MSPTSYQTAPPRVAERTSIIPPAPGPSSRETASSVLAQGHPARPAGGGRRLARRVSRGRAARGAGRLLELRDDRGQLVHVGLVLAQVPLLEIVLDGLGQRGCLGDERLDGGRQRRRRLRRCLLAGRAVAQR